LDNNAVVGLLRLLKRSSASEKTAIRLDGDFAATELWTSLARGQGHLAVIHSAVGSLYVSDGWGVSYASLRFRRLDVLTGQETASFRSGTAVRCFALSRDRNELIAATDSKLFRLDALALVERQRWDTRIPRYSNTMAIRGDLVVVANWRDPKVRQFSYTTSYTTYWLKSCDPGGTVPGMEQVINSANLRRHPGECIARASKGETFVVLRYGRAIAMLRPRSTGEAFEPLRATDLWRDFPRVLARARREAVLITWYSEAVAVLGPVPKGWRRGDES
jgi:hypothetical protein